MQILIAILLLGFLSADEKTNLQPVPVDELKYQLKTFIAGKELSPADSTEIMGIFEFRDFIGVDLEGNPVNYSKPESENYTPSDVVIFGYYAEWCPNCRQNLPAALRLYESYKDKGLGIVLNFMYSNPESVREYANENDIPFPVLIGSEDREENPEVRLETTHYILRTILDDYRRWGTPFYIIYVKDTPDTWYVVAGEFIENEIDEFLAEHLSKN